MISIKATANPALRGLLPPLLGKQTWLLTLQNGLGNEEFVSTTFDTDRILGGVCYVAVNRIEPAAVRHFGAGTITLGDTARPARPVVQQIAAGLERCRIPCRLSEDLNSARYVGKNSCGISPLTALASRRGRCPSRKLLLHQNSGERRSKS